MARVRKKHACRFFKTHIALLSDYYLYMKKLIISEKPSVAADIAKVLGKAKKVDDYYENEQYVIASALGHLVELNMPADIDKKYARWTLSNLPIIPDKFKVKPIEKTKAKLTGLKKLLARKDIDGVINACDAGREGELIFTYIYEITKCKLPRQRLWVSSMTASSILEAFNNLKSQEEMESLQDAARCRSESDWLVGINGTRAVTSRMYGSRGKNLASVGRVQTPTLAMIVEREHEIQNFKPQRFWKITANFKIENGEYEGVYQRPDFKQSNKNVNDKADRIWTHDDAVKVLNEVRKIKTAEVRDKKTQAKQIAPRLYDLTTLQREANNKFSFPANKTLSIAQSLYEKHKLITYPRTDSRALPDDYRGVATHTLQSLSEQYATFAQKAIDEGYVKKAGKRIFDSKQVSDHFAIIPTDAAMKKLSEDEAKIYDMIVRRFIASFYPEAIFDVTTRLSVVGSSVFKTEGKVLRIAGWLDVYNKTTNDKEKMLPQLAHEHECAEMLEATLKEEATKPPARYNEATLLSAMEGAGKLLDDEELADAMKDKGLGTPATRAQIIENLIAHKLLERERRDLVPTARAESLIGFLNALQIEALTSPSMTGEWEQKLRLIERKQMSRKDFMKGISEMTTQIVEKARNFEEEEAESHEVDIKNPIDGTNLIETFRAYKSKDGKFIIYKTIGNRRITEAEVCELVTNGKVGPLDGFKSKLGRPYSATLKLDENFAVKFQFGDGETPERKPENLENAPVIGRCPKSAMGLCDCKTGELVETENAYVCRCAKGEEKKCSFRLGKTMLSHKITRAEIESLTNTGKTPIIEDFVSKRTKKKFAASLVLDKRGGISFEFAKRTSGNTEKKADKKA